MASSEEDWSYGNHEVELLDSAEACLTLGEKRCKKHPGHSEFIPANSFNVNHLPPDLRANRDWMTFVKLLCALTVKITRNGTSMARPRGFPFYEHRGTMATFTGTGFITDLHHERGDCECAKCADRGEPLPDHTDWWTVRIHTASHVLFSQEEVEGATVELFFDSPFNKSKVETLQGYRMPGSVCDNDVCVFECVLNSAFLFKQLERQLRQFQKLWQKLRASLPPSCSKFLLLASHPHGKAKHITIGEWEAVYEKQAGENSQASNGRSPGMLLAQKYTTPTCTGSSGAWVCDFWRGEIDSRGPSDRFVGLYVHSNGLKSGLNKSSF